MLSARNFKSGAVVKQELPEEDADEPAPIHFDVKGKDVVLVDAEPRPPSGDRGQIDHRLANAALERRGNLKDVGEANRIFDHHERRAWEKKYAHFSGGHMKSTGFKNFARAKHDPLNKGLGWGHVVLKQVAEACSRKGVKFEDLFNAADIQGGDQELGREEMRRLLLGVKRDLSEEELTAIFDLIDEDRSGEVTVNEFLASLDKAMAKNISKVPYRAPVAGVMRFVNPTELACYTVNDAEIENEPLPSVPSEGELQNRLYMALNNRSPGKVQLQVSKYHFFPGCNSDRIEKACLRKQRQDNGQEPVNARTTGVSFLPVLPKTNSRAARDDAMRTSTRWVWDRRLRRRVLVGEDPPRFPHGEVSVVASVLPLTPNMLQLTPRYGVL